MGDGAAESVDDFCWAKGVEDFVLREDYEAEVDWEVGGLVRHFDESGLMGVAFARALGWVVIRWSLGLQNFLIDVCLEE